MRKVLINLGNKEFDPRNEGVARQLLIDNGFEVVQPEKEGDVTFMTTEELQKYEPEFDAIITCGPRMDDAFFEKMCPKLKIVARYGSGYDEIDVDSARRHGVDVTITKVPEHSNGVAETAHALLFSMMYHIPQSYKEMFVEKKYLQVVRNAQLKGKTMGIFGFGAIGQRFAETLSGLQMNIIAYDVAPNYEAAERIGVKMVSFDELLAESDIISIHAPALPENYHVFGAETFAKMKDGAYLVNTARGMLVDDKALYEALKNGKLAGAGCDVHEKEPMDVENDPLLTLDNYVATPHIAGHTFESRSQLCICAAQAIVDRFAGKKPYLLVN